jgi:predicted nuclease of restriction endonuclease-like (RecB) superfamily
MKNKSAVTTQEKRFFTEIAGIIQEARQTAYKAVNTMMVRTNWLIGRRIVEQEQKGKSRAEYGDLLVVNLSRYLTGILGGGFSEANLWNFRKFYLTFPNGLEFSTHRVENSEAGFAMRRRIANFEILTWTHWRILIRLDDEEERNYYIREASEQGWNTRQLERNMRSGYFRRLLSTQKKAIAAISKKKETVFDFIKDPMILEFLDVPEKVTGKETALEEAVINNLQSFLLELGKGFSFVARQLRISTETSDFYLDLVFYNYLLKCFVIIDLKTTKLSARDVGQMEMYVRMFDALKRGLDDNPTLGNNWTCSGTRLVPEQSLQFLTLRAAKHAFLAEFVQKWIFLNNSIFCAEKDETIVKYSVLKENKQIFASKYKTILPTEKQLAAMIEKKNAKLLMRLEKEPPKTRKNMEKRK